MNPLLLWMRRGAGLLVPVALTLLLLFVLVPGHRWFLDADWGLRYSGVVVLFMAPVLAAVAAFDASTRLQPTMALVARCSTRGWVVSVLPSTAALLWALLVTAGAWGAVLVTVAAAGGIAPADWWVVPETVLAYAAALALGQWIGSRVRGVMAAVAAAVVVMVAATLPTMLGIQAFQVATSTGTMVGLVRTPSRALVAMGINASIVVLFLGLTMATARGRSRPRTAMLLALTLPVLLTVSLGVATSAAQEFRPSPEAEVCVGTHPTVCGPQRTHPLLTVAQRDLAEAGTALRGSNLVLPARYAIARGEAVRALGTDTAQLPIELSSLVRGHLPHAALLRALSQPRACAAVFSARTAPEYLAYTDVVTGWMDQQLRQGTPGPAPAAVQDANRRLATCPVAAESP